MKAARLALYFFVGLLLGGVSVLSYAVVTVPIESWSGYVMSCGGKSQAGFGSMGAVGTAMVAHANSCSPTVQYVDGGANWDAGCYSYWGSGRNCYGGKILKDGSQAGTYDVFAICPAGSTWKGTASGAICIVASCPPGTELTTGDVCRPPCTPPKTRNLTTGLCDAPPCPSKGTKSTKDYWGPGAVPYVVCGPDNCEVETGFCVGGGAKWACDGGTYTGNNCSGNTGPGTPLNPDGPEKKCLDAGQASGQVNGVTICVPPDSTKNTTNTTKNTTNPSGQTGTTTTTTNTICTGEGSCTSTTTTTNSGGGSSNPGGGSDGTTTTTTAGDKTTYCADHPGDRVCGGGGGGGGNGLGDGLNPPGEEGALDSVEKGVSTITPVNVAGAGGCPADVQLPKGAVFSYAGPCMFAEGMRPIILASAWLLAGLIVLGVARNG